MTVTFIAIGIAAFLAITLRFSGHSARVAEKAQNR
jgi:hypothetical protein